MRKIGRTAGGKGKTIKKREHENDERGAHFLSYQNSNFAARYQNLQNVAAYQ